MFWVWVYSVSNTNALLGGNVIFLLFFLVGLFVEVLVDFFFFVCVWGGSAPG
jgi:hypothetical protein